MLEHWMEWKRRCALGLCSRDTQAALRRFAHVRFRTFLRRYAYRSNVSPEAIAVPPPRDTWHLLETRCQITNTRRGKRYKDWLLARTRGAGRAPLAVIEGGATLILRDAVRAYITRELPARDTVSLNTPVAGTDGALTIEHLLTAAGDPSEETSRREYERLATRSGEHAFRETTRRERLVILAKQLAISLAHPAIEQMAGCRKSMLHAAYRGFVKRVAEAVKTRYAEEDEDAVVTLTLLTLRHVGVRVLEWAKAENTCTTVFKLVEEDA